MQTVAKEVRTVTVRVLRPFLIGGEAVEPGAELQMDYINARGFESAGKATIVADAVAAEKPAPVAVEAPKPAAKKGR
jgi:hypothetical protein